MDRRLEKLTRLVGPALAQRWMEQLAEGKARRERRRQESMPSHTANSPPAPPSPTPG